MHSDSVRIRGYQPADLDDLYRICLLTADSGQDATALFSEPRLPGEIFAAPYGALEPELAFVAEDRDGVAGYVLGALDSRAFEERLERDWWPASRLRYPKLPPDQMVALSEPERAMRRHIHQPRTAHGDLARRFPSHLHIDLLPRAQGRGLGQRMMQTLLTALRAQGSPGVHLFVSRGNGRGIAFYQRLGMTELPAPADSPGRIFALDLTRAS